MKLLITSILSSLIVNLCFSQLVNLKPENLSWKYYKSKGPVSRQPHPATTNFTLILTLENPKNANISGYQKKWHVALFFICDYSWVDSNYLKTLSRVDADSLFHHELYHYFIGMLNAKKCQYELNHSSPLLKKDTFDIYRKYESECSNMTALYDIETNGGLDHKKQQIWEMKVDSTLNSLKATKLLWGLANRTQ